MCRLAAFPPNFPREDAIEILKNFENNNTDGTGAAWIEDGKFEIQKYPKSLTKVLRRHRFLGHMPHNGWTIAHLRHASHGDISKVNTHPFVAGKWVVCHNGTFDEFNIVKLALGNRVRFDGETDSEVASHLIATAGPKKFAETIDFSGVFLALNIHGDLWAIKTSGDLEIQALKGQKIVLASRFDPCIYQTADEAQVGWYHLDDRGRYIKHRKVRESYVSYNQPRRGSSNPCCGEYNKPWVDEEASPCAISPRDVSRRTFVNGRDIDEKGNWPYKHGGD